jgi:cytochrome c oxidase assembly protein subunit 15
MSRLRQFAFWTLGINVALVLWGALVRATGSGAGCGAHWPLCNGVVVQRSPATATMIEYTHRLLSGADLVLVAILVVWAVRSLPRPHAARRAAIGSGVALLLEAIAGAALVKFGWVAQDASAARGAAVVVHLTITFLLLGCLALTAALADESGALGVRGRGPFAAALGLGLATLLVAGGTGALAALGDTLYPPTSLAGGLVEDLSDKAPFLLRLRLVHPFASLASALVLVVIARAALQTRDPRLRAPGFRLLGLLGLQLLGGALNWALLAPVWMQLVHLLLADITWIALVWLAAMALSTGREATGSRLEAPDTAPEPLP